MLILGHVGLTLLAARAADRDVDARAAAALALGPDLLDKPLRFLAPAWVHANTRTLGHSWIGLAAALIAAAAVRKRVRRPGLMWACYAGHDLLDRMWRRENPIIFLWPFLGPWPSPFVGPWPRRGIFWYDVFGELAGFAALCWLYRDRLRHAFRTIG